MMKNYKLLLLALLSVAAPVYAMSQDGENGGMPTRQNLEARFGQETTARIIQAAQRAAQQEQQAEQDGIAPVIDMIACAKCGESHKRPQQVSLGRYVNVVEIHPCFIIPYNKGLIEPVKLFIPVD